MKLIPRLRPGTDVEQAMSYICLCMYFLFFLLSFWGENQESCSRVSCQASSSSPFLPQIIRVCIEFPMQTMFLSMSHWASTFLPAPVERKYPLFYHLISFLKTMSSARNYHRSIVPKFNCCPRICLDVLPVEIALSKFVEFQLSNLDGSPLQRPSHKCVTLKN